MDTECSIDDCTKPVKQRGWCAMHYGRWRRHGDPLIAVSPTSRRGQWAKENSISTPVTQRFWEHVNFDGPIPAHVPSLGPCWLWTGALSNGYGITNEGGKNLRAHVVSYKMTHGELPAGKPFVLHRCDNRACIRDAHLFAGTSKENSEDMVEKDRSMRGDRHHGAQFSDEQIRDIRASNDTHADIATRYGVPRSTITGIKSGTTWKHLPLRT